MPLGLPREGEPFDPLFWRFPTVTWDGCAKPHLGRLRSQKGLTFCGMRIPIAKDKKHVRMDTDGAGHWEVDEKGDIYRYDFVSQNLCKNCVRTFEADVRFPAQMLRRMWLRNEIEGRHRPIINRPRRKVTPEADAEAIGQERLL